MTYTINYNQDQLEAAAGFIWENNPLCPHWPEPCFSAHDVQDQIVDLIRHIAAQNMANQYGSDDQWTDWTGTGGFFLCFTWAGDDSIDVEIYVDPAVKRNKYRYMTEVID